MAGGDPLGYYARLGVPEAAGPEAVKAAYRARAKTLHPDRNPAPAALEAFQALSEAYAVLSDPARRAAYDAGRLTPPRPPPAPTGAGVGAGVGAEMGAARSAVRGLRACDRCGQVTAQPRALEFPVVRGLLWRTVQDAISGVFCRRCADIIALNAALRTWVLGWWAIPLGPVRTVAALLVLLRGGRRPAAANFLLLLGQARAFQARREPDLAEGLARQARGFALTPGEKRQVDGLLDSLQGGAGERPGRVLRDRWERPSLLRAAQLVPPFAAGAVALWAAGAVWNINLWGGIDQPPHVEAAAERDRGGVAIAGLERPALLRTGRLYEVTRLRLPVRTGPGEGYHVAATLDAGSLVLVTENAPEGGWVRILTAEGAAGFVPGRFLRPGDPGKAFAPPADQGKP